MISAMIGWRTARLSRAQSTYALEFERAQKGMQGLYPEIKMMISVSLEVYSQV
jgi:hypothetical protein